MKIHSSFFKPLTLVCFISLSLNILLVPASLAQTNNEPAQKEKPLKHYDVEIILFKNLKVPKGSEKVLPTQAPLLDAPFISFTTPNNIKNAAELEFIIPDNNELRLLDIAKKIKRSSRYKLLTHLAWRQPGLASKDALAIQIRTGKRFGNDYSSIDNPVIPFRKNNKKFSLLKQNNIGKVWYELEGKITITLARYLHTYVDLVLRIPNENKIEINTPLETAGQIDKDEEPSFSSATLHNFAFKEHRRMRSRKLHYLDHPELGMLILITPYEAVTELEFIDEEPKLGSST